MRPGFSCHRPRTLETSLCWLLDLWPVRRFGQLVSPRALNSEVHTTQADYHCYSNTSRSQVHDGARCKFLQNQPSSICKSFRLALVQQYVDQRRPPSKLARDWGARTEQEYHSMTHFDHIISIAKTSLDRTECSSRKLTDIRQG